MVRRSWLAGFLWAAACATPAGGGGGTVGGGGTAVGGGSDLTSSSDAGSTAADAAKTDASASDTTSAADSGATSDAGTVADAGTSVKDSGTTSSDIAPNTGDCCTVSKNPGCGDPKIQECVCAQDDYCCSDAWDSQCVTEVGKFKCAAACPEAPKPDVADAGPKDVNFDIQAGNDCCEVSEAVGCKDAAIMKCVCAQDDYCCTKAWDAICVGGVGKFKCGTACPEAPKPDAGSTDSSGPADASYDVKASNTCCTVGSAPGCSDTTVMDCVCAKDIYCCKTKWDAQCVKEVGSMKCGAECPATGDGG